jgi:hypothetical protein
MGLPVPAPVSADPPNVPVRLFSASDYWELAWWHRNSGAPEPACDAWYLRTYPHLDSAKLLLPRTCALPATVETLTVLRCVQSARALTLLLLVGGTA